MDLVPDTEARPSDQSSARHTEPGARFDHALFAALDAIDGEGLPYALIGGVAVSGMGRPRSTHDIDIFVRAEDADSALEALGRAGFRTKKHDPRWLYKAFMDEMLVDVIFKSQGDIYFDDEMNERVVTVAYHGRQVRVVSPEDLIIIKCAVHNENGPHHWHDALALLSRAAINWDYLLKRARRAPRRLLALLIYAQSSDIWIPNFIIDDLFCALYREKTTLSAAPSAKTPAAAGHRKEAPVYAAGRIKEALERDERLDCLGVQVSVEGDRVLVQGESRSEEQRRRVEEVVHECAPSLKVDNQVRVSTLRGPEGAESVS